MGFKFIFQLLSSVKKLFIWPLGFHEVHIYLFIHSMLMKLIAILIKD